MMILIIPIVAVLVLYLNIRKVAPGNKGALFAGVPILLTFLSFILARLNSAFFASLQCFMVIWICQALWMYILWSLLLFVRAIYRKTIGKRKGRPQYRNNFVRNGSRALLAASVLVSAGLLIYGVPNHDDYKVRTLDVPVTVHEGDPASSTAQPAKSFKAVFFSDLHIDPLFNPEKLERLVSQCDSLRPDFVLFGGDMADIHDSVLTSRGYGKLMKRLAATANVSAIAVGGNHEVYMERSGADPRGFLQKAGWIALDDSTACVPAGAPVACFTGRKDFQKARVFGEERKGIRELAAADSAAQRLLTQPRLVPWIVLDHQPKGMDEDAGNFPPDFALSGHTHDGQFFPGNILIRWIWPLAYGEGVLDGVRWLVSSGIGSWGPPVRAGSDTEIWILHFKVETAKRR